MLDMGRGENLLLINGHKKQKSDCNFWVFFFFAVTQNTLLPQYVGNVIFR